MKLVITCCVLALALGCATDAGAPEVAREAAEELTIEPEQLGADDGPTVGTAESSLACQEWTCVAVKPGTECQGFGVGPSKNQCIAAALNDCSTHCGGICKRESETCVSP